ncbi:uncharacterized protein ARMOST_05610 [Armillaria ostoyae]|uniref:AMP-dependent synthetase/ligase domain-containing protein n=1 Tax=Armillaria ostoyae TaxID=47428 RepID=A0A284R0R5_ARMOS|nr:uncharacterized protein ARMOST_05610 [Armillaria ostoyae]
MSSSTQRLIPPPPQKQGEKSATFRSPPIDGSFTLQQMYDWHLVNSTNHRIFVYARDDGSTRTIYWPEAIAAIYTGARLMKRRIPARHKRPVVAILSMSDTITYFTTMMSLLRANFILFPISPRNSALAVAHLLHKVGVQYVLVGRDMSMQDLARDSLDILKSQYSYSLDDLPNLSPVPVFEELFLQHWQDGLSKSDDLPLTSVDPDAIVLYLHSSGDGVLLRLVETLVDILYRLNGVSEADSLE